jgi:polysaccharide deacetylase family protein (PEP-CTERM system associated)
MIRGPQYNCLTIDVEDWFHILDSDAVPTTGAWSAMECRVERNMDRLLALLDSCGTKATFFWLGWVAKQHKSVVRRCVREGHEIASHGYAHLLAYKAGRSVFQGDVLRAKCCLEDITGVEVVGYRAAGFSVTETTPWALEVIRGSGHLYDTSVFPARRGHGGMPSAPLVPYSIRTPYGDLLEVPTSVVSVFGWKTSLFGGGYLRLAPRAIIKWGMAQLQAGDRPLVVYLHPRDIDPDQPRLPLPPVRRFKCYVNLHTTYGKLKWLCETYHFGTMRDLMDIYMLRPTVVTKPARAARKGLSR